MLKPEKNLQLCPFKDGFYKVPNQPFSVSKNGVVFSYKTLEIISRSLPDVREHNNTYVWINKTHAHFLMAETFLVKPNSDKRLVVNHLNGKVWDNRVENLEWTTHQGNSEHAYMTGLRNDNITLLCKNVLTNEVMQFYSYGDCARYFSINPGRIHNYLHRKNKSVFFLEHYILIKKDEEWPQPEQYSTWSSNISNSDVAAICKEKGKIVLFSSLSNLSEFIGVSVSFLSKKFSSAKRENKLSIEHDNWIITPLTYVEDYIEREFEDRRKTKEEKLKNIVPPRRSPSSIKVTNLQTMDEQYFDSIEQFANLIGESKNTVQCHILRNNGIWHKQFKIEYLLKGPSK